MAHKLFLVRLNDEQIEKAKLANGIRKKITHAVICEGYGQIFGSESYCRKYFTVWNRIFTAIFDSSYELKVYEISDYESTFNLVNKLLQANDDATKTP
ncbi:TPA: hypothetical protein PXM39_003610 [Yersinia enterocolitica]|nr:hypothetical protein [Yersinia enterocolitica]HDL7101147.1 hypothetical protein [Yersinia enterocolitica]HDL7135629.1 hypothetical protein [Yersinia enterocolitica]HDL7147742.1 hypothetical protein [Yersinia enterocolitica]HDL7176775.1 hypothetical protein [Yersinia enterocolitica]